MADDERKLPVAPTSGTKRKEPSETVIWDTVSDLVDYPLVRVAIELAKENFQLCMSKAFKIVDKQATKDHLNVILGLKGSFEVDKNNAFPTSYATSGPSLADRKLGIFFNRALAEQSKTFALIHTSVDDMLRDIGVIGIIAVLQELVEHEIGHLKYHCEGIDDKPHKVKTPRKRDQNHKNHTPTDRSLDGEAGYAVQREICELFFRKFRNPKTIGINEHRRDTQFIGPYEFQLCRIVENGKGKLHAPVLGGEKRKPMTLEDIIKHMDYPTRSDAGSCTRPDYTVDPPTGDGGGTGSGPGGGGNGGDDGSGPGGNGGGGGGRGSGGVRGDTRRERAWMDSVKSNLKVAMADAKKSWNPPEFDFRSNPDNENFDQKVVPYDDIDVDGDAYNANVARFLECEIDIVPCDKDWKERTKFTPDEEIFVKIKIKNVTQERVLVQVCLGSSFGKYGIQLEIVDVDPGYCRGGNSHVAIPIEPSETYCIWRHFTSGNKNSISCPYNTPQTPGQYSLCVEYGDRHHQSLKLIEIVEEL